MIGHFASLGLSLALIVSAAKAEPATPVKRGELPPRVEAELTTREVMCRLDNFGGLVIPQGALTKAELNGDGAAEFIVALCRLTCDGDPPKVSRACDQSVIFVSHAGAYEPVKMPGELLDIRQVPGSPPKLVSSSQSNIGACPVEDGVCNPIFEISNGELVQVGIE